MFTGIVEEVAKVVGIVPEGTNVHFEIESRLTPELKIDQSVAHNGVCLTVVALLDNSYKVTAIKETLQKSNLGTLKEGASINLERAMKLGDRLDGHLVQGHVDQTAVCTHIKDANGSRVFQFQYDKTPGNMTIEKGSITVNGVSLTVVDSHETGFSVAIIPYTLAHTTFKSLQKGDTVNLEFDVIGKYMKRLFDLREK